MRIVITCSGAGGHLFAGLSIAKALRIQAPYRQVLFVGSKNNIARKRVESYGFKYYGVSARGIMRKTPWALMVFIFSQCVAFVQSLRLYIKLKPEIVLGTGGFSTVGIVCWGWLFKKAVFVHEQNSIPGKANRLAAFFADRVFVSYEESEKYFKADACIYTGMPVRFKQKIPKKEAMDKLKLDKGKFMILVMGGSSGSHSINTLMVDALGELKEYKDNIQFVHLTGIEDFSMVNGKYIESKFNNIVKKSSEDMDLNYSAASLCVCRAGSSTLSELAFFGVPSVLIPYPYSFDSHQLKNASIYEKNNAAILIEEKDLTIKSLVTTIKKLINEPEELERMSIASYAFSKPYANEQIVREIENIINEKKS